MERVSLATNHVSNAPHTATGDTAVVVVQMLLRLLLALLPGHPAAPAVRPVPIAVGPRYQLPATAGRTAAALPVGGLRCTARRTTAVSHVELFVRRRAVLLPAGIGIAPPRAIRDGRVEHGRCTYPLSTRDPTGVVYGDDGTGAALGQLFRIWGQPLSRHGLLGFRSPRRLHAFVNGRAWHGPIGRIPLGRRNEVVVELGSLVPPHSFYLFPEHA